MVPLYFSFVEKPALVLTIEKLNSLSELLGHPLGYQAFHSFLEREFALENLMFWTEVRARSANFVGVCFCNCYSDTG